MVHEWIPGRIKSARERERERDAVQYKRLNELHVSDASPLAAAGIIVIHLDDRPGGWW
jgi:hypothetical protein